MKNNTNSIAAKGAPLEVFLAFLKLGCTSFGGPIAHIGYFRKELVGRRQWLSESQFSQLLAICQFLPGPASSQLGFGIGLARAGWLGALAAFVGFTLPSVLLLLGFVSLLPTLAGAEGQAGLHGLKIVAFAVVADAVVGMSKKLCPDVRRVAIAVVVTGTLLFFGGVWAQVLVVVAGAVAGIFLCKSEPTEVEPSLSVAYGKATGATLLVLFFALLVGLPLLAIYDGGLAALADAFYRAGALVFGGGHVVLPLLEDAVVTSGWVSSERFLAGYGAAQAIPGPLFAFSAYLGALAPAGQPAWLGAITALLFMFLPGFLLVAGVLPFWQTVARNASANRAIAGVNAAVVGLLAAALYDPIFSAAIRGSADVLIAAVALSLLLIWRLSPLLVVLWCATASILVALL